MTSQDDLMPGFQGVSRQNDDIVPFVWIRHPRTGAVHKVNHKAHIERLLHEGGTLLSPDEAERGLQLQAMQHVEAGAAPPPSPAEPIALTIGDKHLTQSDIDQLRAALYGSDVPAPQEAKAQAAPPAKATPPPPQKRSHHKPKTTPILLRRQA